MRRLVCCNWTSGSSSSSPCSDSIILILLLLLLFQSITQWPWLLLMPCTCLRFQFPDFSNVSGILSVQEDSWYNGTGRPSVNDSVVWLTSPSRPAVGPFDLGRIVYPTPILLSPTSSFNTSFVFRIITTGAYDTCGSGFSFSVASFLRSPVGSSDGFLGLVNESTVRPENYLPFFAVEFDTRRTHDTMYGQITNDPSGSHIAIDINSLSSRNISDTSSSNASSFYPQLYLYNNYTFTCWIEYSSSDSLIRVWLTNSSTVPSIDRTSPPPFLTPVLEHRYDLSTLSQNPMYLGFSAVNYPLSGCSGLGVALFSWNFSSVDDDGDTSGEQMASSGDKPTTLLIALPIAVGIIPLIFIVSCFYRWRHSAGVDEVQPAKSAFRRRIDAPGKLTTVPERLVGIPQMFSYRELSDATSCFSRENVIGEGTYSMVYKGVLADGSVVAIKRLKEGIWKEAEFSAEMRVISNIRHRNLLKLEGWCHEKEEKLLVYEYMSNGSLHDVLFKMGWEARGVSDASEIGNIKMRILLNVASAVEYLHDGLGRRVLHRDIKAANVLLTEGFGARLADFGLARLIDHGDEGATLTAAGTAGYVAPEVFSMRKISDKSDVYSFGVLMAVVAFGCKALDVPPILHVSAGHDRRPRRNFFNDDDAGEINLLLPACLGEWLAHLDLDGDGELELRKVVDTTVPVEQTDKWTQILRLALLCCRFIPTSRPSMRQVHQTLRDIIL